MEKIKKWYQGKYVPPPENEPGSPIVIISPGHYEQLFLAKAIRICLEFYLEHWKWLLGFVVAISGLVVAISSMK